MEQATFPLNIKNLSDAGRIEGLAAGYGNLDSHGEMFASGAFARSIASAQSGGRQPAMLLHHDPKRPAGRWDSFAETKDGLAVTGQLALDARDGREAYALLKAGALTGLSVGFRTKADRPGIGGATIITEGELFEVSLVAAPSNPLTRITSVKGVGDVRDLEELLREAGFSGRKAKAMATAAWRAAEAEPTTPPEHIRAAAMLADANAALRGLIRS